MMNGFQQKVLIDTWWNVNKALSDLLAGENRVLIDTWWNVNFCTVQTNGPT